MSKDKVMYICPRCDNAYFQVSRKEWMANEAKYNDLARKSKRNHLCPWMRSKKARS